MLSPDLAVFADKVSLLMPAIMREFARRQEDELYKGIISLQQFLVLDALSRKGPSTMSTLARFMGVTTAAMTGIIDRLVIRHYVARADDESDRRVVRIRLTGPGSELVKKIYTQRRHMISSIFSKMPKEDRATYLRILEQVQRILSSNKA
jgi:DNA-binding MarR family transcriptional regulator